MCVTGHPTLQRKLLHAEQHINFLITLQRLNFIVKENGLSLWSLLFMKIRKPHPHYTHWEGWFKWQRLLDLYSGGERREFSKLFHVISWIIPRMTHDSYLLRHLQSTKYSYPFKLSLCTTPSTNKLQIKYNLHKHEPLDKVKEINGWLFCESVQTHTYTAGKNVQFSNVTVGGTYSYHIRVVTAFRQHQATTEHQQVVWRFPES